MNTVLPDHIVWNWKSQAVRVGVDRLGVGSTVLLLPALSSISTRREMRFLQERLAANFTTVAIDWPGFGDEPRPGIRWQADDYMSSLLLTEVVARPFATVAAGHAASYALAVGAAAPNSTGLLCLIAPTWRGPLPTMMKGRRRLGKWITRIGDLPVLGQFLYRVNVNPLIVRIMARGHVYADPDWLRGERLTQKMTVVRAPGARHASIRFVTGMLDLMKSRSEFLETARRFREPILVMYGAATPRRSKAEMQALAALPNVRCVELRSDKLGVHEEFAGEVAEALRSFLDGMARRQAVEDPANGSDQT
jgi:pimeloyl-ACP methyl ester carboxylesterase